MMFDHSTNLVKGKHEKLLFARARCIDEQGASLWEIHMFERIGSRYRFKWNIATFKRFMPHAVAVLALICLMIVSTLLWLEMKRRFPVLEPGGYFGTAHGVLGESQDVAIYVERPPRSDDLLFCVLREGFRPQVVSAVIRDAENDGQGWLLPVTVVGEGAKLKFIGARIGPNAYQGTVVNLDSDAEGTWSLRGVETFDADLKNDQELLLWLRRRVDLAEIERQIHEAETRIPQQKADIEKLTNFISEREQVRESADTKLVAAQDERSVIRQALKEKRDKLARLQERIEIAQRLSPQGKLVTLSRESLERDARWAESLLRTAGAETVPGLDRAVERAEKIAALKREIELEKNLIFKLRYPESVGSFGFSSPTETVQATGAP